MPGTRAAPVAGTEVFAISAASSAPCSSSAIAASGRERARGTSSDATIASSGIESARRPGRLGQAAAGSGASAALCGPISAVGVVVTGRAADSAVGEPDQTGVATEPAPGCCGARVYMRMYALGDPAPPVPVPSPSTRPMSVSDTELSSYLLHWPSTSRRSVQ